MKVLFTSLFVILLVAIGFSGCSGTVNSQKGPVDESNSNSKSAKNSDTVNNSSQYPPLAEKIAQADIELLDGTITKAADRKGKVVLLNLWGIWCGPCRVEMPHLVEMEETYRDRGFQVLGLNIGDADLEPEDIGNIKEFAAEMKLNYELGRISNETTNEFNKFTKFPGVPQSVLIDREGRTRGVFLGGGINVIKKMKELVEKVVNE